jgi:gamma-glutamyltranspeptidase/glutathione hydrolase
VLTRYAPGGAVAAASHLAATAGVAVLDRGGNAVDAAIAASAVMAATSPHMCGLGGDLFALVTRPGEKPAALNASGRAGSGASPQRLREEHAAVMPFRHDIRSVTVPGCVDGWVLLHQRFGTRPFAELLSPAARLAADGFPVSPTLARAAAELSPGERAAAFGAPTPLTPGARLVLPGMARLLELVGVHGRAGFYDGPAARELIELGQGLFSEGDLRSVQANWVQPLALETLGHRLWTVPPNSQGYLVLASAWIAEHVGLPSSPSHERWAFGLVEAARQAAFDRQAVLHEHADGAALLRPERLRARAQAIRDRASHGLRDVYGDGGTTYLCAVDRDRACVSLIMSNAADFGSHLVLPGSGIFLHNRGIGFSLQPGHPAEYGPGRRPPHTLSPMIITSRSGQPDTIIGTMGADAQPQILLQLLVRMLVLGQSPGEAITAPRWVLSREPSTDFDTWHADGPPLVRLEHNAPATWAQGLHERGYHTLASPPDDQAFGHAQAIRITPSQMLAGAADPRAGDGAFAGL